LDGLHYYQQLLAALIAGSSLREHPPQVSRSKFGILPWAQHEFSLATSMETEIITDSLSRQHLFMLMD